VEQVELIHLLYAAFLSVAQALKVLIRRFNGKSFDRERFCDETSPAADLQNARPLRHIALEGAADGCASP
jgi:hypothetical protein